MIDLAFIDARTRPDSALVRWVRCQQLRPAGVRDCDALSGITYKALESSYGVSTAAVSLRNSLRSSTTLCGRSGLR
jgi:hypothetical protein